VLRLLSSKQWLFFLCAFIAWTWDAFGKLWYMVTSIREDIC
jgi:hypothetical protein